MHSHSDLSFLLSHYALFQLKYMVITHSQYDIILQPVNVKSSSTHQHVKLLCINYKNTLHCPHAILLVRDTASKQQMHNNEIIVNSSTVQVAPIRVFELKPVIPSSLLIIQSVFSHLHSKVIIADIIFHDNEEKF